MQEATRNITNVSRFSVVDDIAIFKIRDLNRTFEFTILMKFAKNLLLIVVERDVRNRLEKFV